MILVLASGVDEAVRQFAQRSDGRAKILTCRSLSACGWRLSVPGREPPIAVVEGERVGAAEITGVITRLPYVGEGELPHIAAVDRFYVASEMQAFLFAFLSALPCPVVNRPTPACLAGPNWRLAQWLKAAREAGAVASMPNNDDCPVVDRTSISVVGDQCFGDGDTRRQQTASDMARAAGSQLLRVWFAARDRSAPVIGADLWPDLSDPQIGDAAMALLATGVSA